MSLLLSLFKETAHLNASKKNLKRVSRSCKYLGNAETSIPHIDYPRHGTKKFNEDIEEVVRCYTDPCLSDSFLVISHKSVEDIFKSFLDNCNKKNFDWQYTEKLLKDVDSIVLRLKYKNNRPRPKNFLLNDSSKFEKIKDMNSPSFPSGHTAIAYFLAYIISDRYPDLKEDLLTISEMIAQSRLENGVHFPTDIEYGKLVGEILSQIYLNKESIDIDDGKKDFKNFSKHLRDIAKNTKSNMSDEAAIISYTRDLADFLHRTNEIERYHLDFNECYSAAKEFLMGYPTDYITDNPHLQSQLNALVASFMLGNIDSPSKIIAIHKQFNPSVIERNAPGDIRNYEHFSRSGIEYAKPEKIMNYLEKCCQIEAQPFLKHVLYEWIHPFCDGNGRSGRVMLASDLEYNFDILNQLISDDYISNLVSFTNNHSMDSFFA